MGKKLRDVPVYTTSLGPQCKYHCVWRHQKTLFYGTLYELVQSNVKEEEEAEVDHQLAIV